LGRSRCSRRTRSDTPRDRWPCCDRRSTSSACLPNRNPRIHRRREPVSVRPGPLETDGRSTSTWLVVGFDLGIDSL
jgi:hypothetical protein